MEWSWLVGALALATIPLAITLGRSGSVWAVFGWSLVIPGLFVMFAFVARCELAVAALVTAVPVAVVSAVLGFEADPAQETARLVVAIAMSLAALMLIGLAWTRLPKARIAVVLAVGAAVVLGRCALLLVFGAR